MGYQNIGDRACENRAYLCIKFSFFFELTLTITFEVLKLCYRNFYSVFIYQLESR